MIPVSIGVGELDLKLVRTGSKVLLPVLEGKGLVVVYLWEQP